MSGHGGWLGRRDRSGDWMVEQAVHVWDILHWFKGESPVRASGWGRRGLFAASDPSRDVTDHYAAELEWADGFRASFVQSWVAPADDGFTGSTLRVMGEEGGFDFMSGALTFRDRSRSAPDGPARTSGRHPDGTRGVFRFGPLGFADRSADLAGRGPRRHRNWSPRPQGRRPPARGRGGRNRGVKLTRHGPGEDAKHRAPMRAAHSIHSLTWRTSAARLSLSGEAKLLRTPVPLRSSPSWNALRLKSLINLSAGTFGIPGEEVPRGIDGIEVQLGAEFE